MLNGGCRQEQLGILTKSAYKIPTSSFFNEDIAAGKKLIRNQMNKMGK